MTGKIAATLLGGTVLGAVYLLSMPSAAQEAPSEPASVSTEAPTAPAPTQPSSAKDLPQFALAGPKGFGFASKDGSFSLILHWLLQSDFRGFLSQSPTPDSNTFIVRFAGLRLDASLYQRLHTQVFVNFAESRVTLLDAFIEAELTSWLRVRVGKFPFPISEERLTPGTNLPFVSTSPASFLLPSRDTGVQLLGAFAGGAIAYNLALANGAVAGILGDGDIDSGKDLVARIFAHPLRNIGPDALRELGLGVGASTGIHRGSVDNPQTPIFLTYGGQPFFFFRRDRSSGDVAVASGRVDRLVPHATWSWGPIAAYADAVWTHDRVNETDVNMNAWSVIPTVVLTGEKAAPLSFILPAHPLDLSQGHIGTVELVGGFGHLRLSSSAFPDVANPITAMQSLRVYGLGLNWFPVSGMAVLVSYGHQIFTAAAGASARPNEDTVIARFQVVL
jgi:phosphate-selective porin OprO and OprP